MCHLHMSGLYCTQNAQVGVALRLRHLSRYCITAEASKFQELNKSSESEFHELADTNITVSSTYHELKSALHVTNSKSPLNLNCKNSLIPI